MATEGPALGADLKKALSDAQIAILQDWGAQQLLDGPPVAFGVKAKVEAVVNVLSGGRSVTLVGPRGVGKTAIAREAARRLRAAEGTWPVVQLSIKRRQARTQHFNQLVAAFDALGEVLIAGRILPFFEDADFIRGLADRVGSLAQQLEAPVILEGSPDTMGSMFEDHDELDEIFVRLPIEEPDLETTRVILRELADGDGEARFGAIPTEDGMDEALYLGQRFLSRAHFPRKALDLLHQSSAGLPPGASLTRERVLERFCELHDTPRWLVDPREPLDFAALKKQLSDEVLGQEEAVAAATQLVATMKTGLSDLRRPFGTFLFTGPTGVGKTHLAQTLAQLLFGGRERMVRVNMGDYAADSGTKLFGEPDAYQPAQRRGVLTQTLLGRQFAVLLLDELEKAHPAIFDRLLPLMDEGTFVNGAGEVVSCRSMIIIATTNAGAEVYRGAGIGFAGELDLGEKKRLVDHRVKDVFRFEFLNRFDAVVHFDPLTREACRTIARWELERLRERMGLRRYGLNLSIDDSVLDWLAVHGYHPDFGARFMKRTIERNVTRVLAETIVRRQPPPGAQLEAVVRGHRIHCRVDDKRRSAVAEPTVVAESADRAPRAVGAAEVEARAAPLLEDLDRREAARAELLERMAAPDFWSGDDAEETLDRFRELDVRVAMARRYAARVERWREDPSSREALASALDAVERWEDKERSAGPERAWLVLSPVDVHEPAVAWLKSLVAIEEQFCRRSDLVSRVEAIERHPRGLARVVLEVEGPGAANQLAAEIGLHRLRVARGPDAVVRVELVPRGGLPPRPDRPVRPCAPRASLFEERFTHATPIEVPRLGLVARLEGRTPATLRALAQDLEAYLASDRDEPTPVRIHERAAGVVTDPRTGVSVPARQVEKGRLEPFLDAFRAQRPDTVLTWS